MADDKTGGSAFPELRSSYEDRRDGETKYETTAGMTLLDYFAGKAMQGMVGGITATGSAIEGKHLAGLAKMSYSIAAAMIEARAAQAANKE